MTRTNDDGPKAPEDFIARAVLNLRKHTSHGPTSIPQSHTDATLGTILPARSSITADRRASQVHRGAEDGSKHDVNAADKTPAQHVQSSRRPAKLNGRVWARPTRVDGRGDFSHRNPKATRGMVRDVIRHQGWGNQLAVARIMSDWDSLVGPHIAAHTTPEDFNQEQGILVIRCDSTPFTTNLRYMQSEMLKKIAASIGPNIVEELTILGPEIKRPVYGRLRIKGRGPRDDFG